MLLQAQKNFEIDMANSILIGDKVSDIQAAASAKIGKSYLLSEQRGKLGALNEFNSLNHIYSAIF
jgi:D-glycero-D-manno-heptose 1,7-bisphosphate phosphatase